MKNLWYGDNRDLVKWAALIQIAQEEKITKIIQAAFLREPKTKRPSLRIDQEEHPIAQDIWNHFRNLHNIEPLGARLGIDITVVDHPFDPRKRPEYVSVLKRALGQFGTEIKIVLLDPDTGIEPKTARPEHVTIKEIKEIWQILLPGDWLVVYQHRYRDRQWQEKASNKFAYACELTDVRIFSGPEIANDVALFAAQKPKS